MRSKMLMVSLPLLLVAATAVADVDAIARRDFSISEKPSDLMVENTQLSLLQEVAIRRDERLPDLSFGIFVGQTMLKNQQVNMGNTTTPFVFDELASVGLDVRKHLNSYFGLGTQVEYQTYKNDLAVLHILPATLYGFGRTRGLTKLGVRALAGLGYSAAYIRQIGTVGRTGGLGGRAAFWESGIEVPLQFNSEQWSIGLFYSERMAAEGDFDLSGNTVKLQGAVTL